MKKKLIFLFFCLITVAVQAAEPDSSVVFKADFLKHELQRYDVSRTLYTLQKTDTTSYESLHFKADVFVSDSTDLYYTLTWKFSKFTINTEKRLLKKLIALAKPVEISCRVSKPGVLIEFLDGENISSCLEEALPEVLSEFAGKKGDAFKTEVQEVYDTREAVESVMLKTMYQFHQLYGLGYTLGESVDVPTEVSNQYSSKPFKGIIRKKLTRLDRENGLAILSTKTVLDADEFQQAMKAYLHLDSISTTALGQENFGSTVMDLTTGWVVWSLDQREVKVGSRIYGESVDILHINEPEPMNKTKIVPQ